MIKKIVATTILLPVRTSPTLTDQEKEVEEEVVVKVVVTASRRAAMTSPTKTIELEIDPDEEIEQLQLVPINLKYP